VGRLRELYFLQQTLTYVPYMGIGPSAPPPPKPPSTALSPHVQSNALLSGIEFPFSLAEFAGLRRIFVLAASLSMPYMRLSMNAVV
jgi:hypothetical protein